MIRLRLATPADAPDLRAMIARSVRELSGGYYTPTQVESALAHVFGLDTALIADGTYYVAETGDGQLAGCGGWSRRRTLYGGDQMKMADPHAASDELLDPATEPARIRAFFIDPIQARRGVGSAILRACRAAAAAAGFERLELAATLPGVPFYQAHGFRLDRMLETTLPDGTMIAFAQMSGRMSAQPPDSSSPDVILP